MATSDLTNRPLNSEARQVTMVTPADGPSLVTAPAGKWRWMSVPSSGSGPPITVWKWNVSVNIHFILLHWHTDNCCNSNSSQAWHIWHNISEQNWIEIMLCNLIQSPGLIHQIQRLTSRPADVSYKSLSSSDWWCSHHKFHSHITIWAHLSVISPLILHPIHQYDKKYLQMKESIFRGN